LLTDLKQDLILRGLIHDLNNVFQALVDAADRLSDDPKWRDLSQSIQRNLERGIRISRSLEGSESPGAHFEAILDRAITFVEDARPGSGIRFKRQIDSELWLQKSWAWERVLINLFLNSARAMPRGGMIEVDARRSPENVQISVRDTGSGIPAELLEKLFNPNVSTKAAGGIGLHVVDMIVRQNGGTVTARNRADGPGAEFLIHLPISNDETARTEPSS
jgi:signal transduction histidine kinase